MRQSMKQIEDDDDVVVEHIHEDAKTEEKENETAKRKVEACKEKERSKRPVPLSDPTHCGKASK